LRRTNGASFKGRMIKVELSEDLSREEKMARRAEHQSDEYKQWDETPPQYRAAPGYQPYPGRGRGSGGGSGRGLSGGHREEDFWASSRHNNKMRGGPRFGLSPSPGPVGPTKAQLQPYPYQINSIDTEFGGGYEQPKSSQDSTEEVDKLLNDYIHVVNEATAAAQTELFETGKFSDYIIQCEGIEFKVHRCIVATKSLVLMNVMSLQSSPMLIRDVDSGTLTLLLRFMYSGKFDISGINPAKIMKLLTAADLYQVELVREGLEVTLMENVELDTAVDFLIFSEELQFSNLRRTVSKFICDNAREMKARPDFGKLKQYPHLVMELFEHASA